MGARSPTRACERTVFTDIDECVRWGIYRERLDGTHRQRVITGTEPNWSADGRSFVLMHKLKQPDSNGNPCDGIHVARADGSRLRRVIPRRNACSRRFIYPSFPVLSPDGRHILFQSGGQGTPDAGIWVVRRDGSHARHLVHPDRSDFTIRAGWSPDGRRIVYGLLDTNWRGGVYVMRRSGRGSHRIADFTNGGFDIVWQPLPSRG